MGRDDERSLDGEAYLVTYTEKPVGLGLPLPVDVLLDRFLERVRDEREPSTRKEIVAALIARAAHMTGLELRDLLREYRDLRVRDVFGSTTEENVVPFTQSRPGPRPRSR